MAQILKGAPVVAAMNEANAARCAALKEKGIVPTLAVVRVGAREDDISYEKGIVTRCGKVGVEVRQFHLAEDVTQEELLDVIRQITGACNRAVNESQPIVDARLENGDRVHVVLPPVAVNGPIITIRRFPKEPMTMKRLLEMDSISQEEIDFLADAVRAGYSILVAGGTGSGKTTFLNALSEFIPEEERVVVIEDTAELQIQHVPNLVRLETRSAGTEDCKEISIRDLIRASLRMRPSRIIVYTISY